MSSLQDSLTNQSEVTSVDKKTLNWQNILDLESALKIKPDWYSTKTFEVFLDALDIHKPVIVDDKKNRYKSSIRDIPNGESEIKSEPNSTLDVSPKEDKPNQQYKNVETILSAEALKILSELPDLSQMSVTRSFIFPNKKKCQK